MINALLLSTALTIVAQANAATPAAAPTVTPAAAAHAAAATSTPAPAAQVSISGWSLQCGSPGGKVACQVLDQVVIRSNNAVLGAVDVQLPAGAKSPLVFVQIPLGTAVDDPVRVGFTGGPTQSVPVATCNRNGCFAHAQIGDPLLTQMLAAKAPLSVAYELLDGAGNKQTITITLGLSGFPAMYAKLH
ncbi:MAG TPA: invasion associated locus B family protein [Candidatus Baltobacteraceae bacterium]